MYNEKSFSSNGMKDKAPHSLSKWQTIRQQLSEVRTGYEKQNFGEPAPKFPIQQNFFASELLNLTTMFLTHQLTKLQAKGLGKQVGF